MGAPIHQDKRPEDYGLSMWPPAVIVSKCNNDANCNVHLLHNPKLSSFDLHKIIIHLSIMVHRASWCISKYTKQYAITRSCVCVCVCAYLVDTYSVCGSWYKEHNAINVFPSTMEKWHEECDPVTLHFVLSKR